MPSSESVRFLMVQDDEHERLATLMHSLEVRYMLDSGKYPSAFHDISYPDLLIVWDGGEGPHNPYAFTDEALANNGWFDKNVVTPAIWDLVRELVTEKGWEDQYCVVWLKGGEYEST